MDTIRLKDGEASVLIKKAQRRVLHLTMPAHSIFVCDENYWALEEIAKMRGVPLPAPGQPEDTLHDR